MSVKNRILQYLDYKGISVTRAEQELGWSKSSLLKSNNVSGDKISEFVLLYSDVSTNWLLTGIGNMIKDESPNEFDLKIDDNTILYHYTSLSGFMGIIGDETIRFSELKNSNDLRESLNKCGYKYVCFCLGDKNRGFDKPRMWAQYGDNNNGVCIGFNLSKLIDFNIDKSIEHFRIVYKQAKDLKFGEYNSKESLRLKQIDWMQEKEYRFISNIEDGLYFNKDCIDSIYLGWNIKDIDLVKNVGVNSKIKGMMLVAGIQEKFPINFSIIGNVVFNSINIGKIEKIEIKDVNDTIGRINARKYKEQLGFTNVRLISNYEEVVRENERLRITIESLKKEKDIAHWKERASDVVGSKEGA